MSVRELGNGLGNALALPRSSACASIPAPIRGEQVFTASGTFIVPDNVYSISAVAIGAGGAGGYRINTTKGASGGGGGALRYWNNISVLPGEAITIVVAPTTMPPTAAATPSNGGLSSVTANGVTMTANGGSGAYLNGTTAIQGVGGIGTGGTGGFSGGNGGQGSTSTYLSGGGAGAGGYESVGDNGGTGIQYATSSYGAGGGAGTGVYGGGRGAKGSYFFSSVPYVMSAERAGGVGVMAGGSGGAGGFSTSYTYGGVGGIPGGGGGGAVYNASSTSDAAGTGARGEVRIIWGEGRAFPSTDCGQS